MRRDKYNGKLELFGVVILLISTILVLNAQFSYGQYGPGPNFRNVTVRSTVNITNSFPEIISIFFVTDPVTLNAGGNVSVIVNLTVRDFEGFGDISNVNATFFDDLVNETNDPDDNNSHYTNSSCRQVSTGGNDANYTCYFTVFYYANNGSNWTVNATVLDVSNFTDWAINTTTVNTLLAINVTGVIDFGNLAVGDTSSTPIEANVTNFGNTLINVSVRGFGSTENDGLAMTCDVRNISISNERYSVNSSEAFVDMDPLTGSSVHVPDLQLLQQTGEASTDQIINQTYWMLHVPVATNPAGQCNGSIVFQAELPN